MKKDIGTYIVIGFVSVVIICVLIVLNKPNAYPDRLPVSLRNDKNKEAPRLIDSVIVNKLKKNFIIKVDEFDKDTIYYSKNKPAYINMNGLYSAIKIKNGLADLLYIGIQYYAEDWLFIEKYQFLLDGESFDIIPFTVKRDNEDGMIWEWSTTLMEASDTAFLKAMIDAKSGKIRYSGRHYNKVKAITPMQINGIREGYEMFKAMGGVFKSSL